MKSVTFTEKPHVLMLPELSRAVQVTLLTPSENERGAAGLQDATAIPEPSVAVRVGVYDVTRYVPVDPSEGVPLMGSGQ
jgi:hypothetical protein